MILFFFMTFRALLKLIRRRRIERRVDDVRQTIFDSRELEWRPGHLRYVYLESGWLKSRRNKKGHSYTSNLMGEVCPGDGENVSDRFTVRRVIQIFTIGIVWSFHFAVFLVTPWRLDPSEWVLSRWVPNPQKPKKLPCSNERALNTCSKTLDSR